MSVIQSLPGYWTQVVFNDESGPSFAHPTPKAARAEPAAEKGFAQALAETDAPPAPAPAAAPPAAGYWNRVVFNDEGAPAVHPGEERVAMTAPAPSEGGAELPGVSLFAEGNTPTLWDLLDFINPLQHIPIVNTIYREITGDKIGAAAQLAGGFVLGGPVGVGMAAANVALQAATGRGAGEHVMALFTADEPSATAVAAAAPPAKPAITITTAAEERAAMAAAPERQQPAAAAQPAAAPMLPVFGAGAAPAPVAMAGAEFMPLAPRGGRPAAMRPLPGRAATAAEPAAPPPMPSAAAVRRAAAAQGLAAEGHPMLGAAAPAPPPEPAAAEPPPPAKAQPVAAKAADDKKPNDWFVGQFMQAMDKYDKARTLGGTAPGIDQEL